jgi:hypothetical protein
MLQAFIIYTNTNYNVHGAFPLLYYLPLLIPLAPISNPPSLTWNPPCCDRIHPPRSQVACKLTSPLSTLSQPSPLQIPRTQVTKRPTKTTLRIRHLLSGTVQALHFTWLTLDRHPDYFRCPARLAKNSFQITSDFHMDCRRFPFIILDSSVRFARLLSRLLQSSIRIAAGFHPAYFRLPSGLPQVSIQITSEFYPDAATSCHTDYFKIPPWLPQVFLHTMSPFLSKIYQIIYVSFACWQSSQKIFRIY